MQSLKLVCTLTWYQYKYSGFFQYIYHKNSIHNLVLKWKKNTKLIKYNNFLILENMLVYFSCLNGIFLLSFLYLLFLFTLFTPTIKLCHCDSFTSWPQKQEKLLSPILTCILLHIHSEYQLGIQPHILLTDTLIWKIEKYMYDNHYRMVLYKKKLFEFGFYFYH